MARSVVGRADTCLLVDRVLPLLCNVRLTVDCLKTEHATHVITSARCTCTWPPVVAGFDPTCSSCCDRTTFVNSSRRFASLDMKPSLHKKNGLEGV